MARDAARRRLQLNSLGLVVDEQTLRSRLRDGTWSVHRISLAGDDEYWGAPADARIDWRVPSLHDGRYAPGDIDVEALCRELGIEIRHIIYRRSAVTVRAD